MDKLAERTFRGLHDMVDAGLDLVKNDLDMALAVRGGGEDEGDEGEKEREREELASEVQELKRRHKELLGSVAAVCRIRE